MNKKYIKGKQGNRKTKNKRKNYAGKTKRKKINKTNIFIGGESNKENVNIDYNNYKTSWNPNIISPVFFGYSLNKKYIV
jgi:hypothetical protein